ncbi:hypothetical protein F7725_017873 [Dissostichus mawsoni]|uniref:Calpain catalytic domain-containing protein n=1 Tax=Dissostichus mawsoni TaxID=36200 RepID=A0A7J5XPU3_DISMA|nr:hypothetical protein F7725_017873 [Dissostichus mawsoni]
MNLSSVAEGLKESQSKLTPTQDRPGPPGSKPPPSSSSSSGGPARQFFPLGPDFSLQERPQPVRAVQSSEPSGQRYSGEEIEVLRDKLGKLALSPKQKAIFSRWVRPDELCNNPTMIMSVSSFSIKQTVVSDCSFVASLAISAAYERRYNKKLITRYGL